MMLVKNVENNIGHNTEKTLLTKIETASYNLIDTNHNNNSKVGSDLNYILDLMIMARQVNLFLEENTIFIISVINDISKNLETNLEVKNEEIINEKIRDILQDGEMSETYEIDTHNTKVNINLAYTDKRQQDIKKQIKNYESAHTESEEMRDKKVSETKLRDHEITNKFEIKKTEKIENLENKFLRDSNQKSLNSENNRKLSRKEEVIKSLSYVSVSIKDIAQKVSGCSEKTIQRELNNLVNEGLANRIGEKRWSRYVLV